VPLQPLRFAMSLQGSLKTTALARLSWLAVQVIELEVTPP
jgi:hypothetical protein